jgi:uncharacterized protein DUF4388
MSDERAGPRVAAVIEGVALQNASGALEVDGHPTGVIYLDHGQISYAGSQWSPDLVARLHGTLPPSAGLHEVLAAGDGPDGSLGRLLLERELIALGDLQAMLQSVILDALIVLTVPLTIDASVSGMRLVSGRRHWAADFTRLNVTSVRAEATARAQRIAGYALTQTARLQLRDLTSGSAVLTSEQWALAGQMNGEFSVRDLAWAGGFSLYETLGYVGDLVEAGLCEPCPSGESTALVRGGASASASIAVTELSAGRMTGKRASTRPRSAQPVAPGAGVRQMMPRRAPGETVAAAMLDAAQNPDFVGHLDIDTVLPAEAWAQATPSEPAGDDGLTQVPVESLRRVLDGLRKLS